MDLGLQFFVLPVEGLVGLEHSLLSDQFVLLFILVQLHVQVHVPRGDTLDIERRLRRVLDKAFGSVECLEPLDDTLLGVYTLVFYVLGLGGQHRFLRHFLLGAAEQKSPFLLFEQGVLLLNLFY